MRNLAIIPVRTGSKRLLGKNLREFFGKPLFLYSVECARDSGVFDEVIVSTESEEVAALCSKHGVEPPFLRPSELATDTARLQDVLEHVIEAYEVRGKQFDNFCVLWATAPMRTTEDVIEAYHLLEDDGSDAVIGVTDYDLPVFCAQHMDAEGHLEPVFPDMLRRPTNEMPRVVCDNGTLCWVKIEAFKRHGTWLLPQMRGYHIPRHRAPDIDTPDDWLWAQFLYRHHVLNEDMG